MRNVGNGIEELKHLQKLERLLPPPELTDKDLTVVSKLSALRELVLNNSPITNEGLAQLAELKSLEKLTLHNDWISRGVDMQVTVSGLAALQRLPLTYLWLWNIKMDNSRLDYLSKFSRLEELHLREMPIRDDDLAVVGNLFQLKRLLLNTDTVSDGGLEYLTRLTYLEDFQPITPLTDRGLYHISKMKGLKRLIVKGDFTDKGIQHLKDLESLEQLTLTTSSDITPAVLERLERTLPQLFIRVQKSRKILQQPKTSEIAPAFTLTTFNGDKIKLEDLHDKVVLLYFWATWCSPCVASTPRLKALYSELKERYQDQFVMIGLSLDLEETIARQYVEVEDIPWSQVHIGLHSQTAANYGVVGIPAYILIGPDSKIISTSGNWNKLKTAVTKALGSSKDKQSNVQTEEEDSDVGVPDNTFIPSLRSNVNNEAVIKGVIVDKNGKGVPGVQVVCWRLTGNFPCEIERIRTDSGGRYQFAVSVDHTYEIHAGRFTSTFAKSNEFNLKPDEIYEVEKLKVRPAINSCKGKIVFENGQPATNLSYGYLSKSLSPIDPQKQPKTNNRGEFEISHLLPDELFSFWVFPKENTLCVWKRIDPNTTQMELTLKTSEYIDLPEDWLYGGFTHEAIARDMCFAKDSRIKFSLPDLHGNIISLEDQQFKNKAVLVNLYGSWCYPCRLEIPYLINFKKKYMNDGLEIIGIAFERGSKEEQFQAVKEIAREFKVNYPLLIGGVEGKRLVTKLIKGLENFKGFPTTLYIGRDGLVKHIQAGFWIHSEEHKKWQLKQVEDHIKSLLGMPVN
jgi:thiol-disulfide isomerase/thioredoxin